MKKLGIFILSIFAFTANAQQDAQSSLYLFNPLQFNPAYAGSRGSMNAVASVRAQWVGIKGAPLSQFLSFHSPIYQKNMAYGIAITNDKIGARNRSSFYGNYAYILQLKDENRLHLGLSAGIDMMAFNYGDLVAKDPTETPYLSNFSQTTFNTGAGVYFHNPRFYAGLSAPRLMKNPLKNGSTLLVDPFVKQHYFLATGYVYPINSILDLKTGLLVKMTPNAPVTVDVNVNAFYRKKIWGGVMYRFNESIGVNLAYQHDEKWMFGYAYDFVYNGLNTVKNGGTHEIVLSYDLHPKSKAFGSPRYF